MLSYPTEKARKFLDRLYKNTMVQTFLAIVILACFASSIVGTSINYSSQDGVEHVPDEETLELLDLLNLLGMCSL